MTDQWARVSRRVGQAYLAVVVVLGLAVVLLGVFAKLGRWVFHGPVTGPALERAVAREAGATDAYAGQVTRCRPSGPRGRWTCDVTYDDSGGTVPMR